MKNVKITPRFAVASFTACLCALLFSFLPLSPARAGVDAFRVVTALSGKAWVRDFDRTKRGLTFGAWKPLRVGQTIEPGSEVRVDAGGTLRLQKGDVLEDPAKMPSDVTLYYTVLGGGSAMRLSSQYWAVAHKTHIAQTLRGTITGEAVKGQIPAKDFYNMARRKAWLAAHK